MSIAGAFHSKSIVGQEMSLAQTRETTVEPPWLFSPRPSHLPAEERKPYANMFYANEPRQVPKFR